MLPFHIRTLIISALILSALPTAFAAQTSSTPSTVDAPTAKSFPESEVERLTATGLGKFSQGDFQGAVSEFTNAIKINPKRGGLYLQRGLAQLEQENFSAALGDLDTAYELDKGNRLAVLVCRGRAYLGLKKYDAAMADLNTAIAEDPKFVLAFISRADANLAQAKDDEALSDLEQALSLDPKQPKAYLLRARYYKRKNKNELALKDFNTAVSLDSSFLDREYGTPSQAEVELRDHFAKSLKLGKKKELSAQLIERGMAAERSGEYLEAIREFTDAISDTPDSLEAYKWRASVYMHMSYFDRAIIDLNHAIEITPKDANLYALRAKAHLETGQGEKAIADYSKAIELSNKPLASLFEARGLVYSRLGKSSEAIIDFGKSIELDPSASTAYADRGLEYIVHKRYQDAIADFSNSIERGQDLAVCFKFRGQSKNYIGDKKGAVADLEKAAQLYKNQNDLFGSRQVEKMIVELKKSI
ncbi:MAG: tetratricopeptide repeat protein [Candidatus Obscuribacterales bacterium]|nr:tetratricopeptide repeat protein [Candidatus Obscuribacterales bacterium]